MGIGAGINFTVSGVLQALSNLSTTVVGTVENTIASLVGPWRPPQWSGPPETTITVPPSYSVAQAISPASLGLGSVSDTGTAANAALGGTPTFAVSTGPQVRYTPQIVYVFDGVMKLDHTQEIQLTQHPVQRGANISDHAFIKAAKLSLDIIMSDAMQSYTIGQWSGGSSKSVACFQTLQALATSRTPVTVTSRLKTYTNMVLVSIHAPDDNKTHHGLRATLTFEQIFTASVNVNDPNWSARPDATSQFVGGQITSTPVPAPVGQNYFVTPPPITSNQVTGAGNWSSNPAGS